MIFTPKQLRQAFSKLPDELQDFIASIETVEKIRTAGKNNGISGEALDQLEVAVLPAQLGLIKNKDLPLEIEQSLKTTTEKAAAVYESLRSLVFNQMDEIVKKISADNEESSTVEPPAAYAEKQKTIASVLFARNNPGIK